MKRNYTFSRYFISYLLILCLLLIGFVSILQFQITKLYSDQLHESVEQRLNITHEQFASSTTSIIQTHYQLKRSISQLNYRNDPTIINRTDLYEDMKNLDSNNDIISSIIFLNNKNYDAISTKYAIQYEEYISIYDNSGKLCSFHSDLLKSTPKNDILSIQDSSSSYLFFFPNDTREDYELIYMMDLIQISNLLKNNMIEGITAFALFNASTSQIYGIHAELITEIPDVDILLSKTGIYSLGKEASLYVRANIYDGFSLVALVSNSAFTSQISATFRTAFFLVFLIGIAGVLLILISMKLTYFPLAKLVQQTVSQPESSRDFIAQLNNVISTATTEKEQLQKKIEKYHLSLQKSLLDSGLSDSTISNFSNIKNIEQIFYADCTNCIYMIKIYFKDSKFPAKQLQEFLNSMLPVGSPSITLEICPDYRIYLVNYIGPEHDKDAVIFSLMMDLHQQWGCYCAISNSTSSLMDIPSLYENMLLACNAWSNTHVTAYSDTTMNQLDMTHSIYPYKLLDKFNDNLKKLDFPESLDLLNQLLTLIDKLSSPGSNYPDYIIRCLLIDILITLFNSLNQHDIKFKLYSDLYFETLYYCRSCSWHEKKQEITENLSKLLELFQSELHMIRANQIQEYLEDNFTSDNLSIAIMADHFHVCAAYMSYLFKKEVGENFADYLWNLRYEKAVDLLLHTDMPIEAISKEVGYGSISSFGRKFKQQTGISPSQFRAIGEQHK